MRTRDIDVYKGSYKIPKKSGLLKVKGGAVITSIRYKQSSWEIRMFNPMNGTIESILELTSYKVMLKKPQYYQKVNLLGEPVSEPQKIRNQKINILLSPKEIVTLRLY